MSFGNKMHSGQIRQKHSVCLYKESFTLKGDHVCHSLFFEMEVRKFRTGRKKKIEISRQLYAETNIQKVKSVVKVLK